MVAATTSELQSDFISSDSTTSFSIQFGWQGFLMNWNEPIEDEAERLIREFKMRISVYRKSIFKKTKFIITSKSKQSLFSNKDRRMRSRHRNFKGKQFP